jgi:hypothetical protein
VNDNLPPSLNRFAAELEPAIRRELGPRRDHHLVRLLRARPRLLAGTTIGAAGTGAVLAIVLNAAGSSPAFAVTRNRDDSYSVTLRSLSAIPAANRKLSQMGLHAVLVQAAADCHTPQTVQIPAQQAPIPSPPSNTVVHTIPAQQAPIPSPSSNTAVRVCRSPPLPGGNSGNSGTSDSGNSADSGGSS